MCVPFFSCHIASVFIMCALSSFDRGKYNSYKITCWEWECSSLGCVSGLVRYWCRFSSTVKVFFSQSQRSVQTLLRCSYSPCVQSHTLTYVSTLRIPSSRIFFKRYFSPTVQSLLQCSYSPCVQSRTLTYVSMLKIPSCGSHAVVLDTRRYSTR